MQGPFEELYAAEFCDDKLEPVRKLANMHLTECEPEPQVTSS